MQNNSKKLFPLLFFGLALYMFLQFVKSLQTLPSAEITYTTFKQEVADSNVQSVTSREGSLVLEVELRNSKNLRTVMLPTPFAAPLIEELEKAGVLIIAKRARFSIWKLMLVLLPWLLIFGLMFFFMNRSGKVNQQAFTFGKSTAKVGEIPKIRFADVAGADEAKVELEEFIAFLKSPQKFTRLGGRLPKGALLVGPPGTGKTLLAKAVAGEANRPFFSMSGSGFVEMFVGVGASRVRDLFAQAKAHAPCIVFIDEIDAVGRHRGAGLGGGHDEREQTLNQLLVEMDGFEANEGVILLAATNRPDVLDPALLRPGRFDRQVVVDMPDVKGREGILRVHTRNIPLAPDVKLEMIAKGTPGMTGADLANLVNEAAVLAARRDKKLVEMQDFEDAKDKVMLGVERKSLVLTESERRLTAYHEAGHAVVSLKTFGSDPVHKVTIVPRGRAMGLMLSLPENDRHNYTRAWLIGKLAIAFGGRAAEELVFGVNEVTTGASSDIEVATGIARRMVTEFGMSKKIGLVSVSQREQQVFLGRDISQRTDTSEETARQVDAEIKQLIDTAYETAKRLLTQERPLLDRIANALLERETLNGEEILALVAEK